MRSNGNCNQIRLSKMARLLLAAAMLSAAPVVALAQNFPSKPIRILVGATTGGAPDLAARIIGEKLSTSLGQPVLVENKTGAQHLIASELVAKSPPDGHTLLLAAINHAVNPAVFKKLPYDTLKDFDAVALVYVVPLILVVNPSMPAKSVQELVTYGKANPGKLTFASSGTGSLISMEYFRSLAGLDMLHVPYKGSSASHPDLLSGRTNMIIDSITAVEGYVRANTLRPLAVTTSKRSSIAPNVPTIAESGFPDFDTSSWGGIVAPAGTPKDVLAKLNAEILKAVNLPDVRDRMLKAGMEAGTGSPQQYANFIRAEVEKWARLARIAKIQPE
jgi:tripartite-type tricarboxylate transporter receptor subunit TctC